MKFAFSSVSTAGAEQQEIFEDFGNLPSAEPEEQTRLSLADLMQYTEWERGRWMEVFRKQAKPGRAKKDCVQESRTERRTQQAEPPSKVQGLLRQCALATVAVLGTLATLNL